VTSAGSISGSIRISARQAIAEYAAVRAANATTRAALMASSAAFARVGVAALAAAAPIALLFAKAVSAAASFQKKMDYFGAVTNATQKEMDAVAQKAIDMSKTTVFSADQMADAFVEFGKAGISATDILNGVAEATANLAQAADISMGEAANIMASQLATFKLGAQGAAHVADVLAGAANASIIDVGDLAYSLKYAGGIAASTGVSFDSLVTAISLLGQRGIKGSTAGTSLRQIMVSLATQTKQAKNELMDLGIITDDGANKFIDATGHIKSLAAVMQILQDHERGLTQAEQLAANKRIFNTRALSAVQILMHDGAKGFVDMQNQINKVSAQDVARKRLDNLAGDWRHLKNSINTLLIQVGGPLQDFLRKVVQGLTALVNWFGGLSPQMQKIIIWGLGIVGMFLLLLGTLSLTIALVLKTIQVFQDLRIAFGIVRAGVLLMSAAFRAMAVALLTNPVFLIIAAIAALVVILVLCWKRFAGFRNFVKGMWNDIKGFFVGAWDVLKRVFDSVMDAARTTGQWFMDYLVHPIQAAWDAIVGAFRTAYHAITSAITAIIQFVSYHWKAIIAILLPGIGLVIDAIVTHWTSIVNFTKSVWAGLVLFFTTIWNFIRSLAVTIWSAISNFFSTIWNTMVSASHTVWNALVSFFQGIWNTITGVFGAAAQFIMTILRSAWHVVGPPLRAFWTGIRNFFQAIWTGVARIFRGAWNAISGFMNSVWRNLGVPLKNAATAVWNGIQSIVTRVWNALSGVARNLYHFFDGLYDGMLQVGKNIIIGIWNGIQSLAGWLWDHVASFVKSIWHSILHFFGIRSPSKKGVYAGQMIVQGLANGITSQKMKAVRAIQGVNDAMMAAHNSALNTNVTTQFSNLTASTAAQRNAAMANGGNAGAKQTGGVYVENLNVNNPAPEPASDSLPKSIRKVNYMTAGPAR
jgi:TP901 family phage tail tape measure protein